ncbi:unnamed protein product [Rangifer tarandus platyrhynchus]|uniref:Uncharacterized protein n=2 Tax=Rangifer tarandus platyrhynchus TaxID=3082113 RepID=A0ACB0FGI6_RANTA|nr:unnamed protein product [Rangifer tarandus platyrhynchus]CAI9711898.1 unnamed protein product [Rangifer tarandus platyrhynchus]
METPQAGYLVIIPVYQHLRLRRETGMPGFILPGAPGDSAGGLPGNYPVSPRAWRGGGRCTRVVDCRANGSGREAAGARQAAAASFRVTVPTLRRQTWPSASSSVPGVFSRHLSETTSDHACQNQGRVFDIITTAVKTAHIT